VKRGFSFYGLPADEVLAVWDDLWHESPYGEVLFAAIEYYHRSPKRQTANFWPVIRGWIGRIDNWAHADGLAGLYSQALERDVATVLPQLEAWNRSEDEWEKRISIVSLIHYSGKNAVFMPAETVLPLVTNLLDDRRHYVQTAVGWVLREMAHAYPAEVKVYLEAHAQQMSGAAFSRAIERMSADEKAELRRLRG
jgi:3-methyladenine DNA glycosylase AlkD